MTAKLRAAAGLCGYLKRKLGGPPYKLPRAKPDDPGREQVYGNNWDMHPVGAWIANEALRQGWLRDETVDKINNFRSSNGEEIHGYMWQVRTSPAHVRVAQHPCCHKRDMEV